MEKQILLRQQQDYFQEVEMVEQLIVQEILLVLQEQLTLV
tara:strand:- start:51 stop:170 length:120 start_codon:yes stop_codon:yes gene_type:complete